MGVAWGNNVEGLFSLTHRLVVADGVNLGAEHDSGEGEEQDSLQAKENEEHYSHGRGEITTLCNIHNYTRISSFCFTTIKLQRLMSSCLDKASKQKDKTSSKPQGRNSI